MPNRRGGRDRGNYYKGNEHDDRVPLPQDGTRRLNFKNHGHGGRHKNNRQRGWDNKIRVWMDDDVDMSANLRSNERLNNYQNNRRSRGGGGSNNDRWKGKNLPESPTHWYKVTIRHGHRYEKDYIVKLLASFIKPTNLIPIGYKSSRDETSFAVDDYQAAQDLANADNRITTSDGWKLIIRVRPFTPLIEVDPKLTAAMKAVMASRYNPAVKALDLKKFHSDPMFQAEDLFCPLNRPNIMMAALDIISESIPDLLALDLSENKLSATEHMKIMIEKCPHLKVLHIGNNRIRDIKQMDPLKGLPLEEIVLDGNPLCDKFNERDIYIRDVRQRFPKISKLDGIDVGRPILFDEDEGTIPLSRPSFMASEAGAVMVKQFLQQYYQLYDTEGSREPLHQAYHESAQFSYDAVLMTGDSSNANMGTYLGESRNLTRVSNLDRRVRLLKRGKVSIIQALNDLPKTTHDPTSFIVDLVVFSPQLIQLNVCGLFHDVGKKTNLRSFSRVFIIVPVGPGFCIINDQLTVMTPTQEQIKKVKKQKIEAAAAAAAAAPPPVVIASPVAVPVVPQPVPIAAPLGEPDIATKQQMVNTLSMNSGMNVMWSEKCLIETHWNYDQAMFAFTKLHKAGSIPAEAFVK